jgi:hypothetical protein
VRIRSWLNTQVRDPSGIEIQLQNQLGPVATRGDSVVSGRLLWVGAPSRWESKVRDESEEIGNISSLGSCDFRDRPRERIIVALGNIIWRHSFPGPGSKGVHLLL